MNVKRSTIPATLAALTDRWDADTGDDADGLQVGEGTLLQTQQDFVIVGYDDDDELPAVTGTRGGASFAKGDDTEEYDVLCVLSAWTGDADTRRIRERLFVYLDALDARLATDPSLGGVVARARVTDFGLQQPTTAEGSVATLRFTVHVEAWRH